MRRTIGTAAVLLVALAVMFGALDAAGAQPQVSEPPTQPGPTQPGQVPPGQTQNWQPGPPDVLIVEIALLAELGAWGDEPLPAVVQQLWQVVDLESAVDLDDPDDVLAALEEADDLGVEVLTAIRAEGREPSAEVTATLGGLSDADWVAIEDGDPISVPAQTYADALTDLLSTQGAPPTGPRTLPQANLDRLLVVLDVGVVLERESLVEEPTTVPTTAAAPASTTAPANASSNGSATTDDGMSLVVLLALVGVLALVVVALLVALLSRRRDDAVSEKAQRVEQADGLLDVASRLTRARDLAEVERLTVSEAVRITGADGGGFVAVMDDGLSVTHQSPDALLVPDRIGEGVVSRVIDTGQPMATVSQTEPAVSQLPVSLAAAPIISRGAVQGVLVVIRHGVGAFAEADVQALTKLAPVAAAALETFDRLETAQADALVDPLTRLGNRRSLDTALGGATDAAQRGERPVSVLMIDVDHFKHFNDTNGHAAGDEALRAVAEAITSALREGDSAFRFGGEEFCVVLPGADEVDAVAVGERVRAAVADRAIPGGEHQPGGSVTVSVGVAAATGPSADAVQHRADEALYAAKTTGRNKVITASTLPPDEA